MNDIGSVIWEFLAGTGFANLSWQQGVMIGIAGIFLYLAICRKFEPLLLVPIAFGMILANIPLAGIMDPPTQTIGADGIPVVEQVGGLLYYLFQGDHLGIFPPLIFLGIGAMTDFGPLLANPKSLLLGAAAQLGVFITFWGALLLDQFVPGISFSYGEMAAIAITGGADGPTAIYLATRLAAELLGLSL